MKQVTAQEKEQFFFFWLKQRTAIRGRVSEKTMRTFNLYTERDNVGYEFGQLRPGKEGQWDLYHWLTDREINCDENEALIASGLNAAEVAEEARREYYRENCVDPDDALDVATFERIQRMSPEELDVEMIRLESLLIS